MKTWSILILALALGACATPPTMEELKAEAWQTGDWSEVERREDILSKRAAKREAPDVPECGRGYKPYCEVRLTERRCSCISRHSFYALIGLN